MRVLFDFFINIARWACRESCVQKRSGLIRNIFSKANLNKSNKQYFKPDVPKEEQLRFFETFGCLFL